MVIRIRQQRRLQQITRLKFVAEKLTISEESEQPATDNAAANNEQSEDTSQGNGNWYYRIYCYSE